nr:3-phosphoshikimate 1-carboxyvinyltransferase [Nitrosomonas sp.]
MGWLDLTISQCALGTVKLPGSKSISNRVLLLAALAQGDTLVQNLLVSDDTRHMLDALKMLGISITQIDTVDYQIQGSGGKFPNQEAKLFLGNAGTAFRPLLAVLAIMGGHYYLSGVSRMHERPIGDLVDALKQLHAEIQYLGNPGYPPLEIKLAEIHNTPVTIKGNVSSQFLSGLLMALPLIKEATSIIVDGELISKSYVSLTLAQMEKFGVHVINENWQRFILPGLQTYQSPGK